MSVDKMSVDKMSVDKMSVDKMSVDKNDMLPLNVIYGVNTVLKERYFFS